MEKHPRQLETTAPMNDTAQEPVTPGERGKNSSGHREPTLPAPTRHPSDFGNRPYHLTTSHLMVSFPSTCSLKFTSTSSKMITSINLWA